MPLSAGAVPSSGSCGAVLSGPATRSAVTKAHIVDHIAVATGLTKIETEAVVDGFMQTVLDAVTDGDRVELRGFGTFRAVERASRTARNPHTDETVPVPARLVPVFKPAQEFRRRVEESGPVVGADGRTAF